MLLLILLMGNHNHKCFSLFDLLHCLHCMVITMTCKQVNMDGWMDGCWAKGSVEENKVTLT